MDQHNNISYDILPDSARVICIMVMIHWHWSNLAQDKDDSHKIQEPQSDKILSKLKICLFQVGRREIECSEPSST